MSFNTPASKPSSSFWSQMNWHPSSEQMNQFLKLQSLLILWNKKINLTRLIYGNDYWISQVLDSLWPINKELHNPRQLINCIDVGSGCGLPGLAIAIAMPEARVTLIESIKRKADVLEKMVTELKLSSRVSICNQRAELIGKKSGFRNNYDLAFARAVAIPPVVSEYLVPLLNRDGQALIYCGKWSQKDEKQLNKSLKYQVSPLLSSMWHQIFHK